MATDAGAAARNLGRPPATTHAAIEQVAFALFEERGFDAVTMDDIAAGVGVGRRTLFRYYPSKNDILWGQFDQSLSTFADTLRSFPANVPLNDAVRNAVIAFNTFDPAAIGQHRQRMTLLLNTRTLLAHSELRYAAWRGVIAEYVAKRIGCTPDDLVPVLAGRVSLAISLTAYDQWLREPDTDLGALLQSAFDHLDELASF